MDDGVQQHTLIQSVCLYPTVSFPVNLSLSAPVLLSLPHPHCFCLCANLAVSASVSLSSPSNTCSLTVIDSISATLQEYSRVPSTAQTVGTAAHPSLIFLPYETKAESNEERVEHAKNRSD